MGKGEAVGAHLEVTKEQQIDVDRPGAMARPAQGAPVLRLDRLGDIQQLLRFERGPDSNRTVQKVGLIQDLANRLGLVQRGDRADLDAMAAQVLDRPAQVRLPIAEIRAETEIADAQTPSSSSDSRSSVRSRVTSTPASWTG